MYAKYLCCLLLLISLVKNYVEGYEALLIRTKRKPFAEYDYIADSEQDAKELVQNEHSVRTERNILENISNDHVFQQLVDKSAMLKRHKFKRLADIERKDPLEKLKEFFEELRKRSVDDGDVPFTETNLETKKTDLEIALNILKDSKRKNSMERIDNETKNPDYLERRTQVKTLSKLVDPDVVEGSGEDGSGIENASGDSGDESGSSSGESSDDLELNNRKNEKDFEELLKVNKENAHRVKITERSKRDIDESGNPDFEGLPERLAVIQRENPRTKILKRELKGQSFPDVPLPFNHVTEEEELNPDESVITKKKNKKRKRESEKETQFPLKQVPTNTLASLNLLKRSVGEERIKNLRILDEAKAKSLFDDDEGSFFNHIKRDGIYYDSRSNRFLISAKAELMKKNPKKDEILIGFAAKRKVKAIKKMKAHVKRDIREPTNEITARRKTDTNWTINATVEQLQNMSQPFNVSTKSKPKFIRKRSIEYDEIHQPHDVAKERNDLLRIQRRNVLSDDDPNIDYVMRYDGKTDEIDDEQKAMLQRETQKLNVKKAEEVYKFARSVMDLVAGSDKKKEKRHSESNSWAGVWSGLGTSPEFVPGLIKRDYVDSTSRGSHKIHKVKINNNVKKEDKQIRNSVNRTGIEFEKGKSGTWTGDHGFPLFIRNRTDPSDVEKKVLKRNVLAETQNSTNIKTQHRNPYSHLSLIANRNVIPTEDDYEVLLEKSTSEKNDGDTKTSPKKRRDINEQTEADRMELGSLGSLNLGKHKPDSSGINTLITIQTKRETRKKGEHKKIIKREDQEVDSLKNSHLTTKPFQDGNVVLAFDEVKELLPSQRYFSKDEEDLLQPINGLQSKMVITKMDGEKFDVDKDLAESMVLSGDNKRSHVYGLKATNIVYENNENPVNERSKLDQKPLLTASDKKLQKAQLSNVQTEEIHGKEEQMRNWVNNYKDANEKDTDKRIQEVSDELAESNIELEKLKSINKAEEESAYLAKRLEEKTSRTNDTSVSREEKFKELQQKIFEEQALYRKLLHEQHNQYQEKIKKEQEELAKHQNNTDNKLLANNIDLSAVNEANLSKPNTTQYENTDQVNTSPFQAEIQSPVPEEIHFDKLPGDYIQPASTTQVLEPQAQEHLNRVHPSLSNETFTDETADAWQTNISLSTSPKPSTVTLPVAIQNTTTTKQTVTTTPPPPPPTSAIKPTTTATKLTKHWNNVTTITTTTPKSTENPNITTVAMNKTSISPTAPITLKTTSLTTTAKPFPSTTVSHSISTQKVVSATPTVTTVGPVLSPNTNISEEKINASNTTLDISRNDTQLVIATPEAEMTNHTELENGEENHQESFENSKNPSAEPVLNKTIQKLQFPLEISYRPRVIPNITKKNLEIEPRADGYIGCFIDHLVQGRDLPVRAGIPLVTPRNCRSACKKSGYKYAGLQYGYLCFCGNTYGKYDIVPDDECNTVCSGNDTFSCGGLWRNEIFDTEHVNDTNIGSVQYYMPPKVRQSMDEVPGTVKAVIPSAPTFGMKVNEELLNDVQYSEYEDIKALENIKSDAVRRSNIGIVRNVGNYTDEDLIQAAALEIKLDQANQKDVQNLNHHVQLKGTPPATQDLPSDEHEVQSVQTFTYLHPQKVDSEEPQHSPVLPLNIEPGTHLFRGELMLQQPWYDDLAKPESTKYNILTGNIEVAIRNVFANDSSFLKAEVLSLREDIGRIPHKTVADFTMTFAKNEPTETVTHTLFDSIMTTKRLDEMPVNPNSLKVKEYLHDAGAQAYIPKLVDGQFHLDTKEPIDLKYNEQNQLVFPGNATNFRPEQNLRSSASVSTQYQKLFNPASGYEKSAQQNIVPLNPAVQTHVVPMVADGMTELRNYMKDQTFQEKSRTKNTVTLPPIRMKPNEPKKKKIPYVLRMFFWKDMLARKKREESNIEAPEKLKNDAKKVIHFTSGLPIMREKRSQADEWPTVYKKDDEKKSYSNSLRRRKREEIYKYEEDEDGKDTEFDTLFGKNDPKKSEKRQVGDEQFVTSKTLVSDSLIRALETINHNDKKLHRTKRNSDLEET